nr:HD domain-containing phosphohydrolase [Paenisporosarcina sp. TG20]
MRHHHERYDGKGYPSGFKGDEIPLEARILSIADAFDAITTDRIIETLIES